MARARRIRLTEPDRGATARRLRGAAPRGRTATIGGGRGRTAGRRANAAGGR